MEPGRNNQPHHARYELIKAHQERQGTHNYACQPPGSPPCKWCPLFDEPGKPEPFDPIAAMLAGSVRDTIETRTGGVQCSRLLDTPAHKFKRKGAGEGCGTCGTVPSHDIHARRAIWEGNRWWHGFR